MQIIDILVVDDESPIRDWIVYTIERAGPQFNIVGSSKSGKEAYEMVVKHKPNVIITDIKMPGMDGIQLMKAVKNIQPYTIFIILTNYAEFAYAKEAITYGAKEYILKSELRGVDLINILEEALEEQTELKEGKDQEILSSGYADLYSLYQNPNDKKYIQDFWKGLGVNLNKPYGVIGFFEDVKSNQRRMINDIAKEVSLSYVNAALKNSIVYIIIQEDEEWNLDRKMDKFARQYNNKSHSVIAIGNVQNSLSNFLQVVDEVESTLISSFFYTDERVLYYNKLTEYPLLDKNSIKREYANIISLLNFRRYDDVLEALERWFDNFNRINVADVLWAREICIKAVISLEERLIQVDPLSEIHMIETKSIDSLKKCKEISIKVTKTLLLGKDGRKSVSISEALDYIHKNYRKDISLVKVANHIYRSPEYFSRLFKEEVGVNFSAYLTIYRLNHAEVLLKTTDMQITEIAFQVGYSSHSYFSRIYKKYMGVTPEETRGQYNTKKTKK